VGLLPENLQTHLARIIKEVSESTTEPDTLRDLQKANARLIAAAPEMLEILMELQDIVFLTRNNELHTLMEAAIAKATGN
jgi:hypothetical protein